MLWAVPLLVTLIAPLPAGDALAAEPAVMELPPGAFYRFRDRDGRLVMTSILPKQAIELGYEIIDGQGRVVAVVEKALPEEERQRRLAAQRQAEQDRHLLRLYPTPDDAVRARNRQIEAIQLNIDYASNTVVQLRAKLDQEIAAAAAHERAGREVPANLQATIDLYRRQIREQDELMAKHREEITRVEQEFAPIIARLRELAEASARP